MYLSIVLDKYFIKYLCHFPLNFRSKLYTIRLLVYIEGVSAWLIKFLSLTRHIIRSKSGF